MTRTENILIGMFFMLCCIASTLIFSYLDTIQFGGIEGIILNWAALISIPVFFFLGLRYGIRGLRQDQ